MLKRYLVASVAILAFVSSADAENLTGATLGGMVEQQNIANGQREDALLHELRQQQQQQQWDRIQQDMQRQNDNTARQMQERQMIQNLRTQQATPH
jgi:hypothetical protein